MGKLERSRTEKTRLVERARILLACMSGKRNDQVAAEMNLRPNTLGIWRNRFATQGLAGLRDQARSGRNETLDGGLLAVSFSVSTDLVWRILRKEGIQLQLNMHFTPTSASWLNMVERFFLDISENRLRRGVFCSVPELVTGIDEYAAHHNSKPKPFIWTASVVLHS